MAKPSIPDLFAQLADAARELDQESTRINELIRSYEARLRLVCIDVDVWLEDLTTEDIGREKWQIELGFARLDEGWHLAIRRSDEHPTRTERPTKLLDAPRQMRQLALITLPDLIGRVLFIAMEERWSCEHTRKNLAERDQPHDPPALVQ